MRRVASRSLSLLPEAGLLLLSSAVNVCNVSLCQENNQSMLKLLIFPEPHCLDVFHCSRNTEIGVE